jgi:uncharacterized RDD family membrane protein YckC
MEGGKVYCTSCGWENDDQARFCQRCGAALQATSQEPSLQQSIATAAGVQYAGFWRRFGAALIDGIIINIISIAIYYISVLIGLSVAEDEDWGWTVGFWAGLILTLVLSWIYYAAMESSSKQATLGKMSLGIVVTDLEGRRISLGKATRRYLGKIISAVILYIGFIMIGFTEKKQGLHDMIAQCLVVVKR